MIRKPVVPAPAEPGAQMQPSSESFDEYMARINADKEKQRLLKLKYPDSFPYNITPDLRKGLDMGPKPPVGGAVKAKAFAKGGSVKATSMGTVKAAKPKMGSASSRADGCAIRGKTRA